VFESHESRKIQSVTSTFEEQIDLIVVSMIHAAMSNAVREARDS
jgi:hypothetical protein